MGVIYGDTEDGIGVSQYAQRDLADVRLDAGDPVANLEVGGRGTVDIGCQTSNGDWGADQIPRLRTPKRSEQLLGLGQKDTGDRESARRNDQDLVESPGAVSPCSPRVRTCRKTATASKANTAGTISSGHGGFRQVAQA